MRRLPVPDFVVMSFVVGSLALLMTSGVRFGVSRKQRTSFAGAEFIEDSRWGNQTRYRVLTTAEETGGESFTIEVLVRAGAWGSDRRRPGSQPGHYHLHQDEHIEVKRGVLGYWRGHPDLSAEVAADGDGDAVVIIAPGEAHSLWNAGGGKGGGKGGGDGGGDGGKDGGDDDKDGDLLLEVTFRPARKGEAVYETLAGLGYDYETALAVSPLQRVLTYARSEAVLTGVPAWGWRLCEEWLVPFAEGLGYRGTYPEYSTRRRAGV